MTFFETKDILKSGQLKTDSYWRMFWHTRFRGYHVARTLHVPRRNLLGQISTSTVWILDPGASGNN
ncbi:MAG: hypothetical protein KF886_07055 [Candidatus Hydrogenedentes bacterium]|nr:hypothetical protein [Candidatus Hydrogenedentota bacterium]